MQQKPYLLLITLLVLMIGCTGQGSQPTDNTVERVQDSNPFQDAAMSIYGYQPQQALHIIDSAVTAGQMSPLRADMCKARIYCMSLQKDLLDSLLGGKQDVRLDTALAIGERVLRHDSVKDRLDRRQYILEVMIQAVRMKNDTIGWLKHSREYADICRQLGPDAKTAALRTEAEIGAALHSIGQHQEGMAKLDSALLQLDVTLPHEVGGGTFDELDAFIIALKRKIMVLGSHNKYAETLPLARKIIECLDDYEAHPDDYHDGSSREPKDSVKRDDYIRFYRSQAHNFIVSAYTALGEHENMIEAFNKIEASTHNAASREHIARYNALQNQMEAERQQAKANKAMQTAVTIGILALLAVVFAVIVSIKNNVINRKNRLLAQQIAEAMKYKDRYLKEKRSNVQTTDSTNLAALSDEQLYQYIDDIVIREHLFTDPNFGRETIMERFQLSKERVGSAFSKGSDHAKMSSYIQQLRLEYAAQLLLERPDLSINQIAINCGFSSSAYFGDRFRLHFGMSPSDYRHDASKSYSGSGNINLV